MALKSDRKKAAIIGGGASGFFAAVELAQLRPDVEVHIFEKSAHVLSKVKISGGGRCNVTHACFEPGELVNFYPRGKKELRGPFTLFGPSDTMTWFEDKGIALKIENDGRVFPQSNQSQNIVDTLFNTAIAAGVHVHLHHDLTGIEQRNLTWKLSFSEKQDFMADTVMIASGSSVRIWQMLGWMGIPVVDPVPSLFTFHVRDKNLQDLAGLSIDNVIVKVTGMAVDSSGPLLITHWGLNGPAILKLSAWGARQFHAVNYKFNIHIDFLPDSDPNTVMDELKKLKSVEARKKIYSFSPRRELPKRLFQYFLKRGNVQEEMNCADLSNTTIQQLCNLLKKATFEVVNKGAFKDEFVTAGGVALSVVDFKTYASLQFPGLFFGGEVIDVDALTGGFNFQHAWTSGYIAARGMASYL